MAEKNKANPTGVLRLQKKTGASFGPCISNNFGKEWGFAYLHGTGGIMANDTLALMLAKLSEADLRHIHEIILDCSLAASMGGSYKKKLADIRHQAKGIKKKVVAAIYHARPDQLQRMADKFSEEFQ